MESQPIDDLDFIQPDSQKKDPVVKVVTITLCIICMVFGVLCFKDLYELMRDYFFYRHINVVVFEIHRIIGAVSISSIPLTAYLAWRKGLNKRGFISYLILLTVALFLFIAFCLVGTEVIFTFSEVTRISSWPTDILYPPIPHYCFNLLFILDGLLVFFLFQIFSRKKGMV